MATFILRPVGDSSLNHSCSSGSSGYTMINEASADDDSTYIYQTVSSTSDVTVTSQFNLGGSIPGSSFKVTKATLYVRGKLSSSSGTYSGTYKLSVDSTDSTMSLSTSYQTSSNANAASSLVGNTYDSATFPSLSVSISTTGKQSSSKDDSAQVRVTQSYLEVEYDEVAEDTGGIYVKSNGSWAKYSKVYKKVNGSWALQPDIASVFDVNTKYVKRS